MHPALFAAFFDSEASPGEFPGEHAIVTAYAPAGRKKSFSEDEAEGAALKSRLADAGIFHRKITGRSASGDHAAGGFVVATTLATASEIARESGHESVFWIQHETLFAVDCAGPAAPVRVAPSSARFNRPPTPFNHRENLADIFADDAPRLAAVLRFLGAQEERETRLAELMHNADDSPHGFADWCFATAEFQNRLECAGRVSPFAKKFSYLSCCAELNAAIPSSVRSSLTGQFIAMWDEYGYIG